MKEKHRASGLTLEEVENAVGETSGAGAVIVTDRNEWVCGAGELSDGEVTLLTRCGVAKRDEDEEVWEALGTLLRSPDVSNDALVGVGPSGQYPARMVVGYQLSDDRRKLVFETAEMAK